MNSTIVMAPGHRGDEQIPSRLACSYERPDLGWRGPLQIFVAVERDMVTIVFPSSHRESGGSMHLSGGNAIGRAKEEMEKYTLSCQPQPEWKQPIPTMDGFPPNVRGVDWTELPMTAAPEKETHVGYHTWCEKVGEEVLPCRADYYVLPNGGAKVVRSQGDDEEVREFAPGQWQPIYPTTNFGSRGGVWVESK